MELIRAGADDTQKLWEMQAEAFAELLEKYRDYDTNPASEKPERMKARLEDGSFYYFICEGSEKVGAIRVVLCDDGKKRISPVFIMPQHRRKGYASEAIKLAEQIHGQHGWALETILQEDGNCRLYEALGYKRTGRTEKINERMDLVFYEKD